MSKVVVGKKKTAPYKFGVGICKRAEKSRAHYPCAVGARILWRHKNCISAFVFEIVSVRPFPERLLGGKFRKGVFRYFVVGFYSADQGEHCG